MTEAVQSESESSLNFVDPNYLLTSILDECKADIVFIQGSK